MTHDLFRIQGCNYATSRLDNYVQFHLPQHTGVYKYKCDAGNGCTFKTTRADRLRMHKAGGSKTCPKKPAGRCAEALKYWD